MNLLLNLWSTSVIVTKNARNSVNFSEKPVIVSKIMVETCFVIKFGGNNSEIR